MDPQGKNLEPLHIPEDATVVVYCSVGYRSAAIAERLSAIGIDEVYNLEGGIFAWAKKRRPIYKEDSRTQQVHPYDQVWGRFLRKRYWAPLSKAPSG